MKRSLFLLLVSVLIAFGIRTYGFEVVSVASGSMEPTLPVGIHYVCNKIVYRYRKPLRGEIVVLQSPVNPKLGLIKRVIAIENDTVERRKKQVYLNGETLAEPYAVYSRAHEELVGDTIPPIQVPPGHVFVLGDNRDQSEDSSVWKDARTGQPLYFVPVQSIRGKVIQL